MKCFSKYRKLAFLLLMAVMSKPVAAQDTLLWFAESWHHFPKNFYPGLDTMVTLRCAFYSPSFISWPIVPHWKNSTFKVFTQEMSVFVGCKNRFPEIVPGPNGYSAKPTQLHPLPETTTTLLHNPAPKTYNFADRFTFHFEVDTTLFPPEISERIRFRPRFRIYSPDPQGCPPISVATGFLERDEENNWYIQFNPELLMGYKMVLNLEIAPSFEIRRDTVVYYVGPQAKNHFLIEKMKFQ